MRLIRIAVERLLLLALLGAFSDLSLAPRPVWASPFAYITNFGDSSVSVIDTATNAVTATIPVQNPPAAGPSGVAVHPRGASVYVTNLFSSTVSVIDAATNAVTTTIAVPVPSRVAVDPSGSVVYVTQAGFGDVHVIDTATNAVTGRIRLGLGCSECTGPVPIAVHPASTFLYLAPFNNPIQVIDTATNRGAATIPGGNGSGIAVHPAGTFVYASDRGGVLVIDTATTAITATIPLQGGAAGIVVHPAGTFVYVANPDTNTVSVINAATNAVTATVPVGGSPTGIVVHPAGTFVYVANTQSNTVSVIDTATNSVAATVSVGQRPVGVGLIGPDLSAFFPPVPDPVALSVLRVGAGSGSVTSSPMTGITCGSNCSATFSRGTVVTLTATPAEGSIFQGWGGSCSGTGPCTVTMNVATSVTATFKQTPTTSLVAAVLPASRSVQVGQTATAFATVLNAGSTPATGVGISLSTPVAAGFIFQTTDPVTNVVTGTATTPVDIPVGGRQSFVLALTPTVPLAPTEVEFSFEGNNTLPVTTIIGVNTLLLSASATPVPDIVALAATLNNDGIVNIPGTTGTGVFAVATVNVGASEAITASADTGSASPPVSLSLCQTDPASGQCVSPIGPSVPTQINANATPTFGIFVTGTGTVPFDPAANRIFVRFKDAGGVTRGATSVAVRTQ